MADYNPATDPQSSNALIRAYLTSKGLQANGENVRRALEANAGSPGTIAGLVNSTPSTEAEDQAAMAARRGRGGSRRGHGGGNPFSGGGVSAQSDAPTGAFSGAGVEPSAQTTSAAPPGANAPTTDPNGLTSAIVSSILNGAGVGAGMYGVSRLMPSVAPSTRVNVVAPPPVVPPPNTQPNAPIEFGPGGQGELFPRPPVPMRGADVTPQQLNLDLAPRVPGAPAIPPNLTSVLGQGQLPLGQMTQGDLGLPAPEPRAPATPLETAMERAVPPQEPAAPRARAPRARAPRAPRPPRV